MTKIYTVMIDDNFNYQDKSARYKFGNFSSYGEAAFECKKIVDRYLFNAIQQGVKPENLNSSFKMFAEDPYILKTSGNEEEEIVDDFNAWEWAKKRCENYIKNNKDVPSPFIGPYGPMDNMDGYYDL